MKSKLPSETDLIELIRACPQNYPASIDRAIGDDCAIFNTASARQFVVTSDLLLEDVHFRRDWISPYFLGRKSCLVNVSDLAAMGARPYACLLGLGLPNELTGEFFQEFTRGFLFECSRMKMPLIGGDLSSNRSVVVSVTAWGSVDSGTAICRSGAQPGDHVLLIGKTGSSRLGLEYLEKHQVTGLAEVSCRERLREWCDDSDQYEWLLSHFLPEVHLEPALWIQEKGLANSMIDVSDGLGHDLLHILKESHVSCEVQMERLPCPAGLESVVEAREYALNGGEDYALLLTVSDSQLRDLELHYPREFVRYSVIGRIQTGPVALYLGTDGGERRRYSPEGFNHFK